MMSLTAWFFRVVAAAATHRTLFGITFSPHIHPAWITFCIKCIHWAHRKYRYFWIAALSFIRPDGIKLSQPVSLALLKSSRLDCFREALSLWGVGDRASHHRSEHGPSFCWSTEGWIIIQAVGHRGKSGFQQ